MFIDPPIPEQMLVCHVSVTVDKVSLDNITKFLGFLDDGIPRKCIVSDSNYEYPSRVLSFLCPSLPQGVSQLNVFRMRMYYDSERDVTATSNWRF